MDRVADDGIHGHRLDMFPDGLPLQSRLELRLQDRA